MPAANGPSEPAADAKANYPDTAGVAVDPDDFHSGDGVSGGFARWSGTSFAAAVHAGKCAHAIMGGPPVSPS